MTRPELGKNRFKVFNKIGTMFYNFTARDLATKQQLYKQAAVDKSIAAAQGDTVATLAVDGTELPIRAGVEFSERAFGNGFFHANRGSPPRCRGKTSGSTRHVAGKKFVPESE